MRKFVKKTVRELVAGLRDAAPPSDIRVYNAATMELIRVEKATYREPTRGNKNWGKNRHV